MIIGCFVSRRSFQAFTTLLRMGRWIFLLSLLLVISFAQDSRTVTEPSFPSACTVLNANQVAGSLDETSFDTARIQSALNSCPAGQAVELAGQGGKNAFLIQPITIPSGVTLLVDAEVTVFTSLNRADYPCPSSSSSDCTPIITVAQGSGSGLMGYGIIDGRGGKNLNGESVSWWTQTPLDPRPRMIQLVHADNFTLYKITLQNSTKFHVFGTGNYLTVWGVKITAPTTSPNTDGIDPSGSHDGTITNSFISDGDDHIAIKAGVGHVSNLTISHNKLYQGHGVSIGSETNAGAENVLVTDVVMDGASALNQNVIRIKTDSSKGGEVKNIVFENICAQNPGHPLVFNPFNSTSTGTSFPKMQDIVVHNMHVLNRQNSSTLRGYSDSAGNNFPLGITLNNVELDGFETSDFPSRQVNHVNFTLGPDPVSPGIVSQINTLAATTPPISVSVINNISNNNASYPCSASSFVYLAGELFAPPGAVVSGGNLALSTIVQPIVFGAAAPTGTVSVLEGANVVGTSPITGRVTPVQITGIATGAHVYTAQYSGDPNYAPLSFGSYTLAGTTTTLSSSASSVVYGNSVTVTANVTSANGTPSGNVTFFDGSTSLGAFSLDSSGAALVTASLNAGTHTITASYSGAPGFNVSSAQPTTVQVTPAIPTVTVSCPSPAFANGRKHPYACTAAATGLGGAAVNGTIATTYNGNSIPPFRMGSYSVLATFSSADSNYSDATGTGTLSITHRTGDDDDD